MCCPNCAAEMESTRNAGRACRHICPECGYNEAR
jgi:transposase-like protein